VQTKAADDGSRRDQSTSVGRPSAVNDEPLSGDVAASVTGQQQECPVEVLRLTVPGDEGITQDPVLNGGQVNHLRGELRLDDARGQAVDPDAIPAPLRRPFPGERLQPALGRRVRRLGKAADTD
jgi:hypothetical protein